MDEHTACYYCKGEPEPGYIEMPNNGPLVNCPICNPDPDDFTKAEQQRDMQRATPTTQE